MGLRCVNTDLCRLGEGPCWSPDDGRLYWFDIKARRLLWLEPATGRHGAFNLPFRASAAAPRRDGGLIAATDQGLAHIDGHTGDVDLVEPIALGEGFRTNDGKIDLAGRFWWSSMDDDGGRRPGAVYRTDPGRPTRMVLEGVRIANTLSAAPDGRTFYLAESAEQRMDAYHLTAEGGLADPQPFVDLASEAGTPDGGAVDAEGFLWNAHWGAWRIARYAPDGRLDRVVEAPVEQPTSCAFGGPDLSILYVTSAWDGLDESARDAQPLAGALFAFEPDTPGLRLPLFAA